MSCLSVSKKLIFDPCFSLCKLRLCCHSVRLVSLQVSAPALYQKYANANPIAIDEWTLSEAMAADTSSGGGIGQLEDHYKSFIVRLCIAARIGRSLLTQ